MNLKTSFVIVANSGLFAIGDGFGASDRFYEATLYADKGQAEADAENYARFHGVSHGQWAVVKASSVYAATHHQARAGVNVPLPELEG